LLILITIVVGVMGRNTSKSVAVDPNGNALPDQPAQKPTPQIQIIPTTLPSTSQPAIAPPTRDPLVIASRASGEKQPVFDPPPQRNNPTTRPVAAAKQFKTAPSLVTPVAVNDNVYFCAKDGSFYVLNTDTLDVTDKKKLIEPVQRLIRDGNKLKTESLQPTPQIAVEFDAPIDSANPEDVDPSGSATKINGKSIPLKFRQHLFAEKQIVSYHDKLFRPTSGGAIRILENGKMTEYKSEVVGIGLWKIALLPQGPMGYDNASVYALDEHLCPTKRLINVDPDVGRWSQAHINSFLASNEKTLCFVSAYNNKARMMIWSPHGSKKFREVPVTYNETATTEGNRLALLGDGYLFCGGEMTWLPIGNGAPVRFTTQAVIAAAAQQPSLRAQRRSMTLAPTTSKVPNFTPPVVTADRIFVGHASGSVYVFETKTFSGSSTTASDTAATSP
jgi:outer membrane protein assembly factor BamB